MDDQLKQHNEKALYQLIQQFSDTKAPERTVQIAQRAFYDCLVRELDQHVLFIVNHNTPLAQLAVQAAWIKMMASAHQYDPAKMTVKTWVKGIASRCALETLHRFYKQAMPAENGQVQVDPVVRAEEHADRLQVHSTIVHCLKTLPGDNGPNYKLALKLALDEDLAYQEMRDILAQQSVRQRKLNAKEVHAWVAQAVTIMKSSLRQTDALIVEGGEATVSDDMIRFQSQRFLFVCNKLTLAEKAWMQEMAKRHPQLQKELDDDTVLAEQCRDALVNEREDSNYQVLVPFEVIRRTLAQTEPVGTANKLKAWWGKQAGTPARNTRWALATMLILGIMITFQSGIFFGDKAETTTYLSTEGGGVQAAVLEIVFKPEVTIEDARLTLSTVNARIISGPDRLGLYEVDIPRASMQEVLNTLRDNPLVNSVQTQDLRSRDTR